MSYKEVELIPESLIYDKNTLSISDLVFTVEK